MPKKVIGLVVVLVSLVMVAPLSAQDNGNKNGKKNQPQVSPTASLTDKEVDHIQYMREEEKLARDVYLTLYTEYKKKYNARIFRNIGKSEQRHMNALKKLIKKHGIEDPVKDNTIGEFTNKDFPPLFDDFTTEGKKSYCDALKVGIEIEELDIEDIENALIDIEAKDVNRVLNNLLKGSYNHLGAFERQYERYCEK